MIPARMLLRAATVLALTRGGDGPYPTMAGEAVFDSRLKPVTDIAQETMTPVAMVYTADDKRTNMSKAGGRPTWKRTVTLVIELAISSVSKDRMAWIETDADLEALLDLFELEVEVALADPSNPWAMAWRKLARCIESWDSEPFRSAEQSVRYAVRQISIEIEIAQDCLPQATTDKVIAADGNALSIPYLADLEAQIRTSPIFESTRAMMSGARDLVQLPALKRVALKLDTAPVDGRPDVEAVISMENAP
jgi:hypothetical protein